MNASDNNFGACLQTLAGHTNVVESVAFAPDGQLLASGSDDLTVKLWQVSTGACLQTLTGHTDVINCVTFAPDGQTLASGSSDDTVKFWSAGNGACRQTLAQFADQVTTLAFAPGGQTLASGGEDGVALWRLPLLDIAVTAAPASPVQMGTRVQLERRCHRRNERAVSVLGI